MWSAHTNTCYFALVMLFQCVRKVGSHSYKCGRLGNDFDSFIAGSTYVIYRSILSNYYIANVIYVMTFTLSNVQWRSHIDGDQ